MERTHGNLLCDRGGRSKRGPVSLVIVVISYGGGDGRGHVHVHGREEWCDGKTRTIKGAQSRWRQPLFRSESTKKVCKSDKKCALNVFRDAEEVGGSSGESHKVPQKG